MAKTRRPMTIALKKTDDGTSRELTMPPITGDGCSNALSEELGMALEEV